MEFHLADRPCVAEAIAAAAACATLDELYAAMAAYQGHPDAVAKPFTPSKRATIDNPICIVSEKPEPEDLEAGAPFSGSYGSVMREVLSWTGINMDHVHVAYAVRWTPDGEKSLNATQISTSRPFLFRELQLVAPRAILMPGRACYESLFNRRDPISPLLGMTLNWQPSDENIPCRLVNHPAFALRFKSEIVTLGNQVKDFVDDYTTNADILPGGRIMRYAA